MKQIIFYQILLLLVVAGPAYSTIKIADNNPGVILVMGLIYSDLQLAIGDSGDGDTIFVVGSATSYGTITVNNNLRIFGAGHHPDPRISKAATIGNVTFGIGSNGSVLSGFNTAHISIGSNVDHITITDCWIDRLAFILGKNYLIEGNFIRQTTSTGVCGGHSVNGNDGIILSEFRNNIFQGKIAHISSPDVIFDQNLFLAAHYGYGGFCNVTDITVRNSIFLGTQIDMGCDPCQEFFNIEWYWDGSAWVGDYDPKIVGFNPYPSQNTIWFAGQDVHLETTSMAIGAGDQGQDLGVLGSNLIPPVIYDSLGLAPLPHITAWSSTTQSVQAGGTFDVTISAESD